MANSKKVLILGASGEIGEAVVNCINPWRGEE